MKRISIILSLIVAFAMILAACAPEANVPDAEVPVVEAPDTEEPIADAPEPEEPAVEDQVVTIFGAFVDEDARRFQAAMEPFTEETGIRVEYEGSGDFETLILVRAEGGDPPDIGAFPQPGLLAGLVERGLIIDMNEWFDTDYLTTQYDQSWLDDATLGGIMAGVWYRTSVKSLVWYPVEAFNAAGYTIPETWDEMLALSDQMVADGNTPWCIGIESAGATGWAATDWMEDIMLRTQPAELYDQWVQGELPFDSPEVKNAAEIMGEIWFNNDYVYGGTPAILTTPFGDAPDPMFFDPPGCFMHRQASFIPAFFPEGVEVGVDVDFFYLPPIEPDRFPQPVLVAGDLMGAFNDRPEVRALMEYLTTGESTRGWLAQGGFVSPHNDTPLEWYPTDVDLGYAEILSQASVTRFDASDLMPGTVGAGSFWTGMVDFVAAGGENIDAIMQEIDATFP